MNKLKVALIVLFSLLLSNGLYAQMIADPTTWTVETKKVKGNKYNIIFHLKMKEGWHIGSLDPVGDELQIAPEFKFSSNVNIKIGDTITEHGKLMTWAMDGVDTFTYFEHKVDYVIDATVVAATRIRGTYYYQMCNDKMCLPPKTRNFALDIQ